MQRSEIITVERRRRWRLSEKQEIVAETLRAGASVSAIAQRHGLHPSQLFAWLKAARDGRLIEENGVSSAPVMIASEPVALPAPQPRVPAGHRLANRRRSDRSGVGEQEAGAPIAPRSLSREDQVHAAPCTLPELWRVAGSDRGGARAAAIYTL